MKYLAILFLFFTINTQAQVIPVGFVKPIDIGSSYQGGKVAYIFISTDPGYVAGETHGLIVSPANQSNGIRWFNGTNTTTGATGTAIGTGKANTDSIISNQGATTTSYAAGLARAYNGGGYTDWYLPSKEEVHILCLNKTFLGITGNFGTWSSTDNDNLTAVIESFGVCRTNISAKSNSAMVLLGLFNCSAI